MDAAGYEVMKASEAGADIITILGTAEDMSIKGVIKSALYTKTISCPRSPLYVNIFSNVPKKSKLVMVAPISSSTSRFKASELVSRIQTLHQLDVITFTDKN